MSIAIPKQVLFILSFILGLGLYWPALNGTPIWDDFSFWFADSVMKPEVSYPHIWKNFAWPLSVSIQKVMLSILDRNYFYYHLISYLLHFTNSYLVYRLGKVLNLKYPFLYFILFLLHPSAVITTAWMVQIKTLLSFFFALLSGLLFLEGNKKTKWMVLSWFFFTCSILSKSASLILPLIFAIVSYRTYKFSKIHLLIPFFLLFSWSTYRVLTSPITQEGLKSASAVLKNLEEKKTTTQSLQFIEPDEEEDEDLNVLLETQVEKSEAFSLSTIDYKLIMQTLYYYFWQSLIPLSNEPVKGMNYNQISIVEYLHIIFLLIMVYIFWESRELFCLVSGHIMLLPFIGLLPAPYMNVTWVSDQHLYLSLPFFIGFWLLLIDRIKWKVAIIFPSLFILFFSFKTHESSSFYRNQFTFYEKSLEYNPFNIPMAYNLAIARIMNGELDEAYKVATLAYDLGMQEPKVRSNFYFPYLVQLYVQIKHSVNNK